MKSARQKNSGAAVSKQTPAADQPNEAGILADPGDANPLVKSVFHIREIPSWAELFSSYLLFGSLPASKAEARRLQRRPRVYTFINSELYKRSVSGIYQKCIKPEEGQEIHQGECEHHTSSRALVAKAFRLGFYWPTAQKDAEWLVKSCNGCQRFSKQRHTPAAALQTIPLTWPFAVWGLDLVGQFKMTPGGLTHLLVVVDKFTKWIKAKPIKKLDGSSTIKFFNEITVGYGLPHSIITDKWDKLHKGRLRRLLQQKGHPARPGLSGTSTVERTSRKGKRLGPSRH
jgi:hypothetical protein